MVGCDGGDGGGEEDLVAAASPRDRVKFLCSHGGKILPRPADGHLKYVGGETRVIAVPRDIGFSELMRRLNALTDGEMVLKFQIISEDLDALVSVRSDEDLKHMLDEHDRHGSARTSMLRTFLFPSTSTSTATPIENQTPSMNPYAVHQRYVDAINSVVHTTANPKLTSVNAHGGSIFTISSASSSPKTPSPTTANPKLTSVNAHGGGIFTISSSSSSPKTPSPDATSRTNDLFNQDTVLFNNICRNPPMHRVQSSPNIYSLNSNPQHIHQNLHYQEQPHYYHHHQSPRVPQDPPQKSGGMQRMVPALSIDKAYMGHGSNPYYSTITQQQQRGGGGLSNCGYLDKYLAYGFPTIERAISLPRSPRYRPTC